MLKIGLNLGQNISKKLSRLSHHGRSRPAGITCQWIQRRRFWSHCWCRCSAEPGTRWIATSAAGECKPVTLCCAAAPEDHRTSLHPVRGLRQASSCCLGHAGHMRLHVARWLQPAGSQQLSLLPLLCVRRPAQALRSTQLAQATLALQGWQRCPSVPQLPPAFCRALTASSGQL